jgi:hypothetical protein
MQDQGGYTYLERKGSEFYESSPAMLPLQPPMFTAQLHPPRQETSFSHPSPQVPGQDADRHENSNTQVRARLFLASSLKPWQSKRALPILTASFLLNEENINATKNIR